MSEQKNLDISKVIGLIMENPALIEQIANLANQKPTEADEEAADIIEQTSVQATPEEPRVQPTYSPSSGHKTSRAQLLGALKPYVSKERAKAIDSMISIADILDMMKAR